MGPEFFQPDTHLTDASGGQFMCSDSLGGEKKKKKKTAKFQLFVGDNDHIYYLAKPPIFPIRQLIGPTSFHRRPQKKVLVPGRIMNTLVE